MIKTIIVCEDTTEDFKPINITNTFYSSSYSIQILVELGKIYKKTKIKFHWYISSELEEPIGIYEIPLKPNNKEKRYAVGILEIKYLLTLKELNIYQPWFVIIEYKNQKKRVDFEIKKDINYSLNNSNSAAIIQNNYVSKFDRRL